METKSYTAILHLNLHVPHSQSLKEKRRVLTSLKSRIQNQFNVSVAEIGGQDTWQRAILGISIINGDKKYLEGQIQKVLSLVEENSDSELLDSELEII